MLLHRFSFYYLIFGFISLLSQYFLSALSFHLHSRSEVGWRCHTFNKFIPSIKMIDENTETKALFLASKWKIVEYGKTGKYSTASLEVNDKNYRATNEKVVICSRGGLGINLVELLDNSQNHGIVAISGFKSNSNAAKPISGNFQVGDVLASVCYTNDDKDIEISVEGRSLDKVIDVLSNLDCDQVEIKVKRLVERGSISVEVFDVDGNAIKTLKVLSGFGVNMRQLLLSNDLPMYDERTYRVDSPYQTGSCEGEGSCGTCTVDIASGFELLNERSKLENRILISQGSSSRYRWACRTKIAVDPNIQGTIRVILKPDSIR